MQATIRFIVFLFCLTLSSFAHSQSVTVGAASSLQFVLRDLVHEYERITGEPAPKLVFGSSGNLYRQIVQGAPFDLFFSARSELVAQLNAANLSADEGARFGTGRLVLLHGSDVSSVKDLTDVVKSHVLQSKSKLAIANPAHAPYGRAAKQALQSLNLWDAIDRSVINGEQVSQAAQYVVSGSVSYGLVSLTLALAPAVKSSTGYYLIDDDLHEPIELQMVRLNKGNKSEENKSALQFYNFVLQDPVTDEIFKRYGLR